MSTEDRDWDAELASSIEADNSADAEGEQSFAQPTGTPAGEPAPDVQPEPVAPAEPEPEDTFDGGEFNPDLLDPALQPGWNQLQGAFTRKTQELAEQRKQLETQMSQLGDADAVASAFELYTAIQNPQNWAQLQEELTAAMREQGLLDDEGLPAPVVPQEPVAPIAGLEGLSDDPELAPLAQTLTALQRRLDQYEAREQEQAMVAQAEHEHQQRVQAFEAQEAKIKDLYPKYDKGDWDEIYALTPFYGGNLIAAHQHFETRERARIERYLSSKEGARDNAPSTPSGQPSASTQVEQPETVQDVGDWAVEHIRALQAAGEEFDI